MKFCLESRRFAGYFFFGGYTLDEPLEIQRMLRDFWTKYKAYDGLEVENPAGTLPVYIHGDEGRGQGKRPLLVVSFQPVISWAGEQHMNSTKNLD